MPLTGSPFLEKLPLELREAIYAEALTNDDEIFLYLTQDAPKTCLEHHGHTFNLPPLLRTNSQIRREASKLFFANNAFRIILSDRAKASLLTAVTWLSALTPAERAALKHVTVQFKYSGIEAGGVLSWCNVLDQITHAGLEDPMTAFSHLPHHLFRRRKEMLTGCLRQLKGIEALDCAALRFEVEEFAGDMFPCLWTQCWVDCLGEEGFEAPRVRRINCRELRLGWREQVEMGRSL